MWVGVYLCEDELATRVVKVTGNVVWAVVVVVTVAVAALLLAVLSAHVRFANMKPFCQSICAYLFLHECFHIMAAGCWLRTGNGSGTTHARDFYFAATQTRSYAN